MQIFCGTGKLFQEKGDAVRELCDARQAHGKAVRWLKTFMDHADDLEDEDSRDMLEQVKKRSKCTSMEELRHTEHDKLNACTAALASHAHLPNLMRCACHMVFDLKQIW